MTDECACRTMPIMDRRLETIRAKKSLGQHFLKDKQVPRIMADAATVSAGDTVLEVGPGTGVLTQELLHRGAHVIAVETDSRSVEALNKTFVSAIQSQQLQIVECDILNTTPSELGLTTGEYKVVANIPYYISGQLFRFFLDTDIQPSTLVFLVQKEVAERIVGPNRTGSRVRSEKESLLSLSVKAFGTPTYIKTVKKRYFSPPPKVDSAIIAINDISHNRFDTLDAPFFFELLHLGFAARRKQLLGNLSKVFAREILIDTFSTLGIDEKVRGEDLSIEMWLTLAAALAIHR